MFLHDDNRSKKHFCKVYRKKCTLQLGFTLLNSSFKIECTSKSQNTEEEDILPAQKCRPLFAKAHSDRDPNDLEMSWGLSKLEFSL